MTKDITAVVTSKLEQSCALAPGQGALAPEQKLEDLNLDSLALLETIYDLEEHYDIVLEPTVLTRLTTVSDLIAAIDSTLSLSN